MGLGRWRFGTGLPADRRRPGQSHVVSLQDRILLCALFIFVLIFGLVRWLEGHRFGYYMRAVREGQETAESLGVNSTAVKLTAMALSAAMSAICGAFFAQYNLRVDPPMVMSLDMSMKFVLITILGGAGTLVGPLLGAVGFDSPARVQPCILGRSWAAGWI